MVVVSDGVAENKGCGSRAGCITVYYLFFPPLARPGVRWCRQVLVHSAGDKAESVTLLVMVVLGTNWAHWVSPVVICLTHNGLKLQGRKHETLT